MSDLLPGEKAWDWKPGDMVTWRRVPRGGWAYPSFVRAVVVKVGPKRVTIDAELRSGGTKRVSVAPSSLEKRLPR